MCFFDTHMHLTKARLEDALCRMLKENKICALSVAGDFYDSVLNAQFCGENIYVGVGLHPCFSIGKLSDKEKDDWNNLLNNNKIVCIGECGLDDKAAISLDDQLYNLRFFCDLAAAYSLPLSVHIRNDRVFLYSFSNGFNSLLGHLKRFCNSGCDGRQGGIMLKCRDHLFLNHENYMYFAIHLITRTK